MISLPGVGRTRGPFSLGLRADGPAAATWPVEIAASYRRFEDRRCPLFNETRPRGDLASPIPRTFPSAVDAGFRSGVDWHTARPRLVDGRGPEPSEEPWTSRHLELVHRHCSSGCIEGDRTVQHGRTGRPGSTRTARDRRPSPRVRRRAGAGCCAAIRTWASTRRDAVLRGRPSVPGPLFGTRLARGPGGYTPAEARRCDDRPQDRTSLGRPRARHPRTSVIHRTHGTDGQSLLFDSRWHPLWGAGRRRWTAPHLAAAIRIPNTTLAVRHTKAGPFRGLSPGMTARPAARPGEWTHAGLARNDPLARRLSKATYVSLSDIQSRAVVLDNPYRAYGVIQDDRVRVRAACQHLNDGPGSSSSGPYPCRPDRPAACACRSHAGPPVAYATSGCCTAGRLLEARGAADPPAGARGLYSRNDWPHAFVRVISWARPPSDPAGAQGR